MGRRLSPEVRRAEIIATADNLIAAEGFHSLSLRELARRCGMSAPGLMHHFADLETLLVAVLEHRDAVDLAAIVAMNPADATIDEVIEGALLYYERIGTATKRYDALEAEALDPGHPAHAYFLNRDERSFAVLRPYIEREFENPDQVLLVLRTVFDGLRMRMFRNPEAEQLRQNWHEIRDLVLGSFRRRSST